MSSQTPPSPFRPTPKVITLEAYGSKIDAIGDVHGCVDEAVTLLHTLGHSARFPQDPNLPAEVTVAPGRALVFLGDLTDRGPRSRDALRLLEGSLQSGHGYAVMGNHDSKLLRTLAGQPVSIANGLQTTLDELESVAPETRDRWRAMLHTLPHQIKAPTAMKGGDGWVTFAHGAAPQHHQDEATKNSLNRALYGYADGTTDSLGNLIRDDWALSYSGPRLVVHGHTPMAQPRLKNRVACIDTGAVFGGHLSALSLDTLVITQVASAVNAKDRPGVTKVHTHPGSVRQFPLTETLEAVRAPATRYSQER